MPYLQNTPSLFVDEIADSLNSSSSGKSSDRWLGNALNSSRIRIGIRRINSEITPEYLDVVPQDLAMPHGTCLPETLSSFSVSIGDDLVCKTLMLYCDDLIKSELGILSTNYLFVCFMGNC